MLSFDRRHFLVLALSGAAAGCGFKPTHSRGSNARKLVGQILLPEATSPVTYAFRERMRRRFGDGGTSAKYRLNSVISLEETGLAITQASDVTRFRLSGTAEWELVDRTTGQIVFEGEVTSLTGYDAAASAYASRAAKNAAQDKLATELAELTAARLSALANQTLGS